MVASLWPTRRLLLEIGRRQVAAGQIGQSEHVFHLSKADLLGFLRGHWDGRDADALAQDRAVQVPVVLRHIKDGETLTVDGDAATVSRIP